MTHWSGTKKITVAVLVTVVLVLFGTMLQDAYSFGVDDSFIFYRYAENIAAGKGFVFNAGEPAGEGFTSWLWTLMLAASHWMGIHIIQASKILGILFHLLGAGLVFLVVQLLLAKERHSASSQVSVGAYDYDSVAPLFGGLVAAVFLLNYRLIAHSVSGMETSLYVFTILLLTYLTTRALLADSTALQWWWILALTTTCAFWVRPEGIVAGGIALLAMAIAHWRALLKPRVWFYVLGGLVVPVLVFILIKVLVFGYPLPHSYYHKLIVIRSEYNDSLRHLLQFISAYGWLMVMAFISAGYAILKQKKYLYLFYTVFFMAMTAIYLFFYPVMNYLHRFYIPYLPLLLVMLVPVFSLMARALVRSQYRHYRPVLLLLVFVLLGVRMNGQMGYTQKVVHGWSTLVNPAISRALLGRVMADLPANMVVANSEMGVIPYYSGLTCIDMAGLTDPVIAHSGLTMAYLETRHVDLILFPRDVQKITPAQWQTYTINYKDVFLSRRFKESFQFIGAYPAWTNGPRQYYLYANHTSPRFDAVRQWWQRYETRASRPATKLGSLNDK